MQCVDDQVDGPVSVLLGQRLQTLLDTAPIDELAPADNDDDKKPEDKKSADGRKGFQVKPESGMFSRAENIAEAKKELMVRT